MRLLRAPAHESCFKDEGRIAYHLHMASAYCLGETNLAWGVRGLGLNPGSATVKLNDLGKGTECLCASVSLPLYKDIRPAPKGSEGSDRTA